MQKGNPFKWYSFKKSAEIDSRMSFLKKLFKYAVYNQITVHLYVSGALLALS